MNFIQKNKRTQKQMLETIGVNSIDQLFDSVPENIKTSQLNISGGKTEQDILKDFSELANKNKKLISFRGAGNYDHFVPSLVSEITERSEFWTAYTPYQSEASQGTLQAIFEYQSLICALTGLDVSNASLYDGAVAVAEAALLALRLSGKTEIIVSEGLNPQYIQTLKTYLTNSNAKIKIVPLSQNGNLEKADIDNLLSDNIAAVIAQSPNYLGIVEDMSCLSNCVKIKKALFISVVNLLSLGVFQTPGEYNCDIAVGEGQPLGLETNFGGATFGFMAVHKGFEWKLPGRIVGQTVDINGKRGFVLTLQSREQHIRREKAYSNTCTNASLNALSACVYLAGWGSDGLKKLGSVNISKARYAFNKIKTIDGLEAKFKNAIFFNEFVFDTGKNIKKLQQAFLKNNILGPLELSAFGKNFKNSLLFCVTEQRTKEEIDKLVEILRTT
ncbi:MAG: aminomethyl-transferring glycine dehydrogenase subunit GcvPA [Elusimicrobiota bacterium]|jgi:glycine dehydrogenase subunit 1|nr:aminomethyl-transferring glycine dehydrogenase subunit GcvPA [Elusimicrobiota bacterium]